MLFIVGINCHIKVVANLIKSEDFKLKGTFTINSANAKNKYLSIHKNYILFSKNRHNYDIIILFLKFNSNKIIENIKFY